MKQILLLFILIFMGCELPDTSVVYEDKLVVFCNLNMIELNENEHWGEIAPVKVSMSSIIDGNLDNTNQLYINDSLNLKVEMIGYFDFIDSTLKDTIDFQLVDIDGDGEYFGDYLPKEDLNLWPNKKYILNVNYVNETGELYEVQAETTTPQRLNVKSIQDYKNCEECSDPTIFGQTNCENNGETWIIEQDILIDTINTSNFSSIYDDVGPYIWAIFDKELGEDAASYIFNTYSDIIDEISLSRYGCKVGSFASFPYFVLDFNNTENSAIRILSYSLESEKMGLEPWTDHNNNGVADEGEFFDYNLNTDYDLTRINTFYDTTNVFQIWKGPYLRDDKNNPFLYNPYLWNVNVSPSPVMWLYFNYYGKHLIMVQAADQAYYDYFSGDPIGKNPYILPDSNIEGGYGLFSSTFSKAFFIDVKKVD